MGFRFQKRIRILPGLRLNVSKTGISWTVGRRGASVTARDGKLTGNVGLPGTGLSYRKRLDLDEANVGQLETTPKSASKLSPGAVIFIFLAGVIVGFMLKP
jgi:hypothetical protein